MTEQDTIITILAGILLIIIGIYIVQTLWIVTGLIVMGIGSGMIGGVVTHYFSKGK